MHSHHSHAGGTGQILKWSFIATVLFVALELIAGLQARSLALLSDAGHNLTDSVALLFTWFAFHVQSKPANAVKTYGYHRMGVLAAFLNALTLVLLSAWIFYESAQRFLHPSPVQESVMMMVAAVGLLMNGGIMWSLGSSAHALSCHAMIEDVPPSAIDRILQRLNAVLCDRFEIRHTTVQFEHVGCAVSESGCVIPTSTHSHHDH